MDSTLHPMPRCTSGSRLIRALRSTLLALAFTTASYDGHAQGNASERAKAEGIATDTLQKILGSHAAPQLTDG